MLNFVTLDWMDLKTDHFGGYITVNLDDIISLESNGYVSDGKVTFRNGKEIDLTYNGVDKITKAIKELKKD